MSIFNPWGELRALKARLAAEEEAYRVEEAQQQAEWARKDARLLELERSNAVLRRDNEDLRRELKETVSRGANNNIGLEHKLSDMTAQRNKANNALKRKDRALERREAEVRLLKDELRGAERKVDRVKRDTQTEIEQLKAIRVRYMSQNVEIVSLKQQVEALIPLRDENRKLKAELAKAIDPRDPKTGRFVKKEKAQ